MLSAARYFRAIVSYFPIIWQYAHFDDAPPGQCIASAGPAIPGVADCTISEHVVAHVLVRHSGLSNQLLDALSCADGGLMSAGQQTVGQREIRHHITLRAESQDQNAHRNLTSMSTGFGGGRGRTREARWPLLIADHH